MAWTLTVITALSFAIWLYLLSFRGGFWRADQRLDEGSRGPEVWPAVVVLVPARDEAEVIGAAVAARLAQDYPGPLQVVVIDDHSADGTAALAERAAAGAPGGRLQVIAAPDLPPGWTGKLWALRAGLALADRAPPGTVLPDAPYLWLSDADIAPGPATLRRLVAHAEAGKLNLVSLMVALSCRGPWERLLIPPFIYFSRCCTPSPGSTIRPRGSRRRRGAACCCAGTR